MDIDFEHSKVHIRGEYTKTKVDRFVYLTTELADQLKLWIDYKYRERRRYMTEDKKNIFFKPQAHDTDLVFSSSLNQEQEHKYSDLDRILASLYVSYSIEFSKVTDRLKIGFEDITKRRRKIILHSFRRFVKTTISDLGYQDLSDFYIGHAGSTYWRKPESEKFQLFKRLESSLTYLDQTGLEKKHADLQTRLEVMERENLTLQRTIHERDTMSNDTITELSSKLLEVMKKVNELDRKRS
jgi:hypothetical protein